MGLVERIKRSLNVFNTQKPSYNLGPEVYVESKGRSFSGSPDASLMVTIKSLIANDVASHKISHVVVDESERFSAEKNTTFNRCLTLSANLDQTASQFKFDLAYTMLDRGHAVVVPVNWDINANGTKDLVDLRIGYVTEWYPAHVKVSLYDERSGQRKEIVLEKETVAIVESPLASVMNQPNSTFSRLTRKLALLDAMDSANSSGKLDIIIQLPFTTRSEQRKEVARQRRDELEKQLMDSTYGIAYADANEKITQLNRPAENNLLAQVTFLTEKLYAELGVPKEVILGTADERQYNSYRVRTVYPILTAIVEELTRKFISTSAYGNKQRVMFFKDPFATVPMLDLATAADKFIRNQILSANEVRAVMGMPPSADPVADQLVNPNMPAEMRPVPTGENYDQEGL